MLQEKKSWDLELRESKLQDEICQREVAKLAEMRKFRKGYVDIIRYLKHEKDPEPEYFALRAGLRLNDLAYCDTGCWFTSSPVEDLIRIDLDGDSIVADRVITRTRVLWLRSAVGTGKTILMLQALRYLRDQQEQRGSDNFQFAHYICSARATSAADRPRDVTVLRGLCQRFAELSASDPSTPTATQSVVCGFYETVCSGGIKPSDHIAEDAWLSLLKQLIGVPKQMSVIVIDALDECSSEDGNTILKFLAQLLREIPQLRVLVSSRENVDVDTYFPSNELKIARCTMQATHGDVQAFIGGRLSTLEKEPETKKSIFFQEEHKNLRLRLHDALLEGARGMFKWVDIWLTILFPRSANYQTLHPDIAEEKLALISKSASDMSSDFDQLTQTYDLLWKENTKVKGPPGMLALLFHLVLSSFRRLSLGQVYEAWLVSTNHPLPSKEQEADYASIRLMIANFLVLDKDNRFVWSHESAKEYVRQRKMRDQGFEFADVNNDQVVFDLCCQLMQNRRHPAWRRAGFVLENTGQLMDSDGNFASLLDQVFFEFEDVLKTIGPEVSSMSPSEAWIEFRDRLKSNSSTQILYPFLGPKDLGESEDSASGCEPETFPLYVVLFFAAHAARIVRHASKRLESQKKILNILKSRRAAIRDAWFSLAVFFRLHHECRVVPQACTGIGSQLWIRFLCDWYTAEHKDLCHGLFSFMLRVYGDFEMRAWCFMGLGTYDEWKEVANAGPQSLEAARNSVHTDWPMWPADTMLPLVWEDNDSSIESASRQLEFTMEYERDQYGRVLSVHRNLPYENDHPLHWILSAYAVRRGPLRLAYASALLDYHPEENARWDCGIGCRIIFDRISGSGSVLYVRNSSEYLPIHLAAELGEPDIITCLLNAELDLCRRWYGGACKTCGKAACPARSPQLFEGLEGPKVGSGGSHQQSASLYYSESSKATTAIHLATIKALEEPSEKRSQCVFVMLDAEQEWCELNESSARTHAGRSELLSYRSRRGWTIEDLCLCHIKAHDAMVHRTEVDTRLGITPEKLTSTKVAAESILQRISDEDGPRPVGEMRSFERRERNGIVQEFVQTIVTRLEEKFRFDPGVEFVPRVSTEDDSDTSAQNEKSRLE